ncbi:hypothetical protein ACH5RR_006816, partial [Cinchona calisaya]
MKMTELVFVLSPGRGYIVAIIELAKCLLEEDQRLSLTILVIKRPYSAKIDSDTEELAAINTNIRFIDRPQVDPPESMNCFEHFMPVYIDKHKSHVKDAMVNTYCQNQLLLP